MITIKRYSNRKLYIVGSNGYTTLTEILTLVKENKDFQVIDSDTGNDITDKTLRSAIGRSNVSVTALLSAVRSGVNV